jgi:nitrate reductase alpha subunit
MAVKTVWRYLEGRRTFTENHTLLSEFAEIVLSVDRSVDEAI